MLIQQLLSTDLNTSATSDSSERGVGCVGNTVEPEEPEIENDGDTITGTICDDKIKWSNNRDIIRALAGDDDITARDGDDVVYGNDGDDIIHGNDGDDVLQGGEGADQLNCGDDVDTVLDYNPSQGDAINANCEIANSLQ